MIGAQREEIVVPPDAIVEYLEEASNLGDALKDV